MGAMRKIALFLSLTLLGIVWVGCKSTVTNISVSKQTRNSTNLYPVEAVLDVREQALRLKSVTCTAMVGLQKYPMRPVRKMDNRWEGYIVVPPDVNAVDYFFKFDYESNAFGQPKKGSQTSPRYRLQLLDK